MAKQQNILASLKRFLLRFVPLGTRIVSHWSQAFDFLSYSPQAFYGMVEEALKSRQIPQAFVSYEDLLQASIFSSRRTYLIVRREKLKYYICAAPFGTSFCLSTRLIDERRPATLVEYFLALLFLGGLAFVVLAQYGSITSIIVTGFVFTGVWSIMRLASVEEIEWLRDLISRTPLIGPIYIAIFWRNTFYRQDMTEMFNAAVHLSVMQAADAMSAEKGIRPISGEERKPKTFRVERRE